MKASYNSMRPASGCLPAVSPRRESSGGPRSVPNGRGRHDFFPKARRREYFGSRLGREHRPTVAHSSPIAGQ
eukprot:59291-Pyramimonas_sp.AAC.1